MRRTSAFAVALFSARVAAAATFDVAAGDVPGLVTAIANANANGEDDVVNLAPGATYTLTALNNGQNGLPAISSRVERSSIISNALDVPAGYNGLGGGIHDAGGGAFTIVNATIAENTVTNAGTGRAEGGGISADGGGTWTLQNVTIARNGVAIATRSELQNRAVSIRDDLRALRAALP